jgi:uncharacterized repeat protein (TIGR01451 family)
MRYYLIIVIVLLTTHLNAQTWIPIPDTNFNNYLIANFPAGAFMTNGTDFFVDADHPSVQAPCEIWVSGLNISSLEGIQAFINLNTLVCSNNPLTTFPPLPATLINLQCDFSQLSSLPTLPQGLVLLSVFHNQLTSLPDLPDGLITLDCLENQLTELPPLPESLISLNTSGNLLSELPDLPSSLGTLYCHYNQLTELPELPVTLTELGCEGNHLTALPVLPTGLVKLYCAVNLLTVLPDLPDSLTQLMCSDNQLTDLPDLPDSLLMLGCQNNQISCFKAFSTNLDYVVLFGNPFTCLPNYVLAMDSSLLNYPLCTITDPVNNLNGCENASGIIGSVFNDINDDCITGGSLVYIPIILYDSDSNVVASTLSMENDTYYFAADSGTYQLSVNTDILNPSLQVSCPVSNALNAEVTYTHPIDTVGNFGLHCVGFDIGVQSVVPFGWFFPGQTHQLEIFAGDFTAQYEAFCAAGISGEVTIAISGPGTATFDGTPATVSGNTATYALSDFGTANANRFTASILTDTTATSADEFCVSVSVTTTTLGDLNPNNNTYNYCYPVVNSYDPNHKLTYPELVQPGYADEFTYTIEFQNTGNAPAMNIRLADTLDGNLDLSTLKIVGASDEYSINLNMESRRLDVFFPDIMLPDSMSNPTGSIGYIQYRIKPLANQPNGTVIQNTAYIYFDYNSPIVTNTSVNLFTSSSLGLNNLSEDESMLYPNPSNGQVWVESKNEIIEEIGLHDINGVLVKSLKSTAQKVLVDLSNLDSGMYFIVVRKASGTQTKRLILKN